MIFKLHKGQLCEFEFYENHQMKECGNPSILMAGKKCVCIDHVPFALMAMKATDKIELPKSLIRNNDLTADGFIKYLEEENAKM